MNDDQLKKWDQDNFCHAMTPLGQFARGEMDSRIIKSGSGSTIVDGAGNSFLDAFSGLYCVNVGYGRSEISDAIAEQARELAYYHAYVGHGTEASITLANMVMQRAPKGMSKVYFGLSGSDANETNIKLIWYFNNILGREHKKKIISRKRGYHGSGLMTGSLTGLDLFHKKFDLPFAQVLHTEAPYYFRREDSSMSEEAFSAYCAESLNNLIEKEGADTIAAFIAEPVMGTGGLVPPPKGYWQAIQQVLARHDVLLIADEVVTGFGRTGSMMGSHHFDIKPDFITIAKGLTSAYAPLSGSIISDRVWQVLERGSDEFGPLGHGWTYSAHPISAAAGVANLRLLDELKLVHNAKKMGAYFFTGLQDALADHPNVGDIRNEGLMGAIEFVTDRKSNGQFDANDKIGAKIAAHMLSNNVIARAMPQGDIIGYAPPFCLTEPEADRIIAATKKSVEAILQR